MSEQTRNRKWLAYALVALAAVSGLAGVAYATSYLGDTALRGVRVYAVTPSGNVLLRDVGEVRFHLAISAEGKTVDDASALLVTGEALQSGVGLWLIVNDQTKYYGELPLGEFSVQIPASDIANLFPAGERAEFRIVVTDPESDQAVTLLVSEAWVPSAGEVAPVQELAFSGTDEVERGYDPSYLAKAADPAAQKAIAKRLAKHQRDLSLAESEESECVIFPVVHKKGKYYGWMRDSTSRIQGATHHAVDAWQAAQVEEIWAYDGDTGSRAFLGYRVTLASDWTITLNGQSVTFHAGDVVILWKNPQLARKFGNSLPKSPKAGSWRRDGGSSGYRRQWPRLPPGEVPGKGSPFDRWRYAAPHALGVPVSLGAVRVSTGLALAVLLLILAYVVWRGG